MIEEKHPNKLYTLIGLSLIVLLGGTLSVLFMGPESDDPPPLPPPPDLAAECKQVITSLILAVQVYDDDNGTYPESGIDNLKESLSETGSEGTPYHPFKGGSVLDPWGHPLVYINNVDGTAPPDWSRFEPYVVYSTGPNGKDERGEGDDVASWN